jgi:rhamnulokinase
MVRIAVDLGAESGRVIAGNLESQEVVHRFPTRNVAAGGVLYWDALDLFREIKAGLKAAFAAYGDKAVSIGVDSWGVDYGLVDADGSLLGNPRHYRDRGNDGFMEEYVERFGRADLYAATGIQFMPFNTVFQLMAERKRHPERLAAAASLLNIPDLINFWLTGRRANERTIASTTGLVDGASGDWAWPVIDALGLPRRIFGDLVRPGTALGPLAPELAAELGVGHPVTVMAVACHDTGSAVAAVPATGGGDFAYLSSGTWSLLGVELAAPLATPAARDANFTNEAGAAGTTRFLKNIMGLWILQECKRQWEAAGKTVDYAGIEAAATAAAAAAGPGGAAGFDVNDRRFLKPNAPGDGMADRVRAACAERGPAPAGEVGPIALAVFASLADSYARALADLGRLTDRPPAALHVIGGGSKNALLNRLTAGAAGIPVHAGPAEATALGNLLVQALGAGEIESLAAGRALVARGSAIETYR